MASSSSSPDNNSGMPSSSTFSFKAPFPVSPGAVTALKQRRVSLASPSSPRVVQPFSFRDEMGLDAQTTGAASSASPEKKGKMRKLNKEPTDDKDKKPRKKWSQEETMMLVSGCQIHGVGNWKTILQDPTLTFHDRTAVDLKDRFRTYFPDAYKKHYPNAKTHLSSKIRSTMPDGTSLFDKTRSKRRRPFTEAEDRALKAGYEKHGTTWATIAKDPVFQEQNRRSTDLRDRFRNAFPQLYQAAGYKPRTTKKSETPARAADDQMATMSSAGPVRSRRRAQSSQGRLRGGTKSVPQSTACSEDEEDNSSDEESAKKRFKRPSTPVFTDSKRSFKMKKTPSSELSALASSSSAPETPAVTGDTYMEADDEMDFITIEADPLNIPDFMPNDTHSDMDAWSSGINTPTHSSTAAWSTAGASPTSSHDFLSGASNNPSNVSSPFMNRRNELWGNNLIGKSAWGPDWFSPNPRMDASSASSASSSSFVDVDAGFSPASPFSFHPHLNHGVLDRYDLFPPSMPNDVASDAGVGDTGNDESGSGGASAGGTGFKGYHSQIAGDLISGAGARQPFSNSFSQSLAGLYGSSFGGAFASGRNGLGLQGIPEDAGIHPMQLHAQTSSFSGLDELGLTGISLSDHDSSAGSVHNEDATMEDAEPLHEVTSPVMGLRDGMRDLVYGMSASPEKLHQHHGRSEKNEAQELQSALLSDPLFSLADLVDMSHELHATPPATPLTHPRPLRRSSAGTMLNNFDGIAGPGGMAGGLGHHVRSISVPPTEARNGVGSGGGGMNAMSIDDVGLHMHSNSSSDVGGMGKGFQYPSTASTSSLFTSSSSTSASNSSSTSSVDSLGRQAGQRMSRNPTPMRLSHSVGTMQPPGGPISPRHLHQATSQQHSSQGQHHQQQAAQAQLTSPPRTPQLKSSQPATLFPAQLLLNTAAATSHSHSGLSSPSSPHSHVSSPISSDNLAHTPTHLPSNGLWRLSSSSTAAWMNLNSLAAADHNVPYLDLHYHYGSTVASQLGAGGSSVNLAALDGGAPADAVRQGQALDLAQSAIQVSASGSGSGVGGPSTTPFNWQSIGTIRPMHHKNPPSDSFAAVAAALAAATVGAAGSSNVHPHSRSSSKGPTAATTGTIRQSHFKTASSSGTLGRSLSHHRGQSAAALTSASGSGSASSINPQDLMLRSNSSENKRKRASWDGGLA